MNDMTSKERMLTAMNHGQPDRVPVSPDISNMIPCRLTGRPFWKIYYENDPPLWKAYADAVHYFGFDGWQIHASIQFKHNNTQTTFKSEITQRSEKRFVVRTTCNTPAGDLWQEVTYYDDNPPTLTRGWIKDLRSDLHKIRYLHPRITGYDASLMKEQMDYSGDTAVVSVSVPVPGLHDLAGWFDGGLQAAVYAEQDCPEEFEELMQMRTEQCLQMSEMVLDARPDFFMIGASGLYTMQSARHFRKYSLPVLAQITKMSKDAGLPSFLHSCGKQKEMIEMLAAGTDLDVVNPLEIPPMGDCDLAEVKQAYGERFALMGNIHTTDVMLMGTPEQVKQECEKAIADAALGGGFILSTGDQCGRDTPFENIRAMVETAHSSGRY